MLEDFWEAIEATKIELREEGTKLRGRGDDDSSKDTKVAGSTHTTWIGKGVKFKGIVWSHSYQREVASDSLPCRVCEARGTSLTS